MYLLLELTKVLLALPGLLPRVLVLVLLLVLDEALEVMEAGTLGVR